MPRYNGSVPLNQRIIVTALVYAAPTVIVSLTATIKRTATT